MLMREYVGTKRLLAVPMNLGEYNRYRGWDIPENEDPQTPGYLVEYPDGGASNHPAHNNYISWSPKDVFRAIYHEVHGTFGFGRAIECMKVGLTVARVGWNGKDMFLYLVPAASYPAQTGAAKKHWGEDAVVPYGAYIAMKTAQGNVVPWLASQTDVLADDWSVV